MSYLNDNHRSVITSYVERHSPYKPAPKKLFQQRLAELAVQLKNLKDVSWSLEEEVCEHYVYVFLDPRKPGTYEYTCPSGKVVRFDHQPFYVGKGRGYRVNEHFNEKWLARGTHKNNVIRSILAAGMVPLQVMTVGRRTDHLAQALEVDLIAGIGRSDAGVGPLTNKTDGSDGGSGYKHTHHAKERIRKAASGRGHSAETRRKISELKTGKRHSEQSRQNMREGQLGRYVPMSTRRKISEAKRGVPVPYERRERISATLKGRPKGSNSEEHNKRISEALRNAPSGTCPTCGKTGKLARMKPFHFDNCTKRKK